MVIIGYLTFPPESSNEMGKRLLQQPPLPSYITLKGHYVSSIAKEGIRSVSIYDFDQSKFPEAFQFVTARFARYYGVPGFTYSIQPWHEASEALKILGMG